MAVGEFPIASRSKNFNVNLTPSKNNFSDTKLAYYNSVDKAGACEYGNELSGSIKCGEFLD